MKRLIILFVVSLLVSSASLAQKRYDEIKYPKLNNFEKSKVEEFTLDNGIRFFMVEDRELPLINVDVTFRTGSLIEPEEKTSLASITAEVLREGGSKSYPADELNVIEEDNAATFYSFGGSGSVSVGMDILKEDLDELLPVMIDLIQNPLFPEEKIELSKTQRKSGISRRNDDMQAIGAREFRRLIYGNDSPYTRQTEYETLDNVTRDDIAAWHKQYYVGANMMIGVIGDFDTKEMKAKLQEAFGAIPTGQQNAIIYPEVSYDYNSTINYIEKSDVNQSYVTMGHIGGLRDNPDYASLQVMNQILSGGFAGRLFQVVRTDLGLAYSVGGSYGSNISYPGQFRLTTMTKSESTGEAIDAIIGEVKRLQNEPVSQKELDDTKDRFLNSLVFRYDSKRKILNERINNEYLGLSQDAFDKLVDDIKKVSIADVQRVAKEYLKPDQMQILVVGNREEIGDQLQKYGSVNEIDISIPQPQSDEETVAGDPDKGKAWLKKMATALLGSEGVKTINQTSTSTQVTPYGNLDVKAESEMNYATMTMKATLTTPQGPLTVDMENGNGSISMMGQQLPPQALDPLKKEMGRHYLVLAMKADELSAEYLGTEEYEGTTYEAIRIGLETPVTYLLDAETALPAVVKVKEFAPQLGKQIEAITTYSDWKMVEGGTFYLAYFSETFAEGEKVSTNVINSASVQ
ncbi:MAG: pitrilysin family protein [Bacteroidota bacterium]